MREANKKSSKRTIIHCLNCFESHDDDEHINSPTTYTNYSATPFPSDIEAIIISKLDLVTLFRCTVASPSIFIPAVKQLTTLSTTLPRSMYLYDQRGKSSVITGPLLDAIYKFVNNLFNTKLGLDEPRYLKPWWPVPRLSRSGKRFFRTLVGLKSLELELPVSAACEYFTSRGFWFRWYMKVGMGENDPCLVGVVAEIMHEKGGDIRNNASSETIERLVSAAWSHIQYHLRTRTTLLGRGIKKFPNLKSFVSKDVGKNGKLEENVRGVAVELCPAEHMVCLLPPMLELKNKSHWIRFRKTWVFYLKWTEVGKGNGDGGTRRSSSVDDLIMDCLRCLDKGGEEENEDKERRELRLVVTQVLHHNRKILYHHS